MKIKSIFILSILFFLAKGTKAQIEFPIVDAAWCYSGYDDTGNDLGDFCFSPSGLVEIKGKTYSKIEYKPHPYGNSRTIFYREAERKFFVLPQDSLNEILVYDFNLEIGDTFQTNWAWGLYDSITLTVQNVDTLITLDGVSRKKIILENESYYGTWIEGIGDDDWVFVYPSYQLSVSGGYTFSCHSQLNEFIFSNGITTACDVIDSTEEIKIASILEVYPNPTDNIINIRLKNGQTKIVKIVNLSGKEVFKKQIETSESTIQISKPLESGIYLIQVYSRDGWVTTTKFVKI